ncbi:MAG: TIGR03087 family PEP-CTERM/XrtA system glycosyltransferase [Planctomycetota bacterium]
MLTHRFPYPPNRGDRIRSYNILRFVAEHFSVSLGCTSDEPIAHEELGHIQAMVREMHIGPLKPANRYVNGLRSLAKGQSLTEGMFASSALASQVCRWQRERPFDAVLVFCSSMFPYIDNSVYAQSNVVVDLVDVDSEKWREMASSTRNAKRWLFNTESKRVRRLEQRIADRASAVTLVSELEADLYKACVNVPADTYVEGFSNGVDTNYFYGSSLKEDAIDEDCDLHEHADSNLEQPTRLVFTGVLDYAPNVDGVVWFCEEVLPLLRRTGNFVLSIVGRRPTQQVLDLGQDAHVDIRANVPDVRPYLRSADIAISPLHLARGIQNKVLEAMSMGLAVVATHQSAEGIEAVDGRHLVVADSSQEWSLALQRLVQDTKMRNEIGAAARELVVRKYSWASRLAPLKNILRSRLSVET